MKDQLISLEVAKLAREKGFNFYQINQYSNDVNPTMLYNYTLEQCKLFNDVYYAPTQNLLQKWLREKHNIVVYAIAYYNGKVANGHDYAYEIYNITNNNVYKSWEEALEAGLLQALKLIK
mgnify:CR=1 FL=1